MSADPPHQRVLICDDVEAWRMVVATVLRLSGGIDVVAHAENGVEAIAAAEREQPDVILLDIAMPRLDGIKALPRIRAAAPNAHIVMLSGFNNSKLREEAMSLGANAFLEKGVDPQQIVDAVRASSAARTR